MREKSKREREIRWFFERIHVHSNIVGDDRKEVKLWGEEYPLTRACVVMAHYNVYDKFAERRVIQTFSYGTFSCETMQHKIALFRSDAVILNSLGTCLNACDHNKKNKQNFLTIMAAFMTISFVRPIRSGSSHIMLVLALRVFL